jgi:hypothetical protein
MDWVGTGQVIDRSIRDRSVGKGSVAKKFAADPPSFNLVMIIIVRIQLLHGLVTKNSEPENSRA